MHDALHGGSPVAIGLDLSSTRDMTALAIHGERGSGRTTAQLVALPDGAAFLVATEAIARYCRGLLVRACRLPDALTFITPDNANQALRGHRFNGYDVDHAYDQLSGRRGRQARADLAISCACLPPES